MSVIDRSVSGGDRRQNTRGGFKPAARVIRSRLYMVPNRIVTIWSGVLEERVGKTMHGLFVSLLFFFLFSFIAFHGCTIIPEPPNCTSDSRMPSIIACVGGKSEKTGLFHALLIPKNACVA